MSAPSAAAMRFGEAVWESVVVDRAGKRRKYLTRGAPTAEVAREAIVDIINTQTRRAVASGADDPGLNIVSIICIGGDGGPIGTFAPSGARAVDLNHYVAPAAREADGKFDDLF